MADLEKPVEVLPEINKGVFLAELQSKIKKKRMQFQKNEGRKNARAFSGKKQTRTYAGIDASP